MGYGEKKKNNTVNVKIVILKVVLIVFYVYHRMEHNTTEEAIQALRNLVLLVGSLTSCGYIELKPKTTSSGSLFQMPGFTVPQPTGKGMQC